MKTIELIVSPDGSSKVETKGFGGTQCQQASRFLEQALGKKQNEKLTSEYFKTQVSQTNQARQQ
ncbi:DUF2997 domain-containing protein [Rhodopirellula sp. MGV]|uniref:DUF2997 domain-containing protein n=1 Tax=Rhodopirellula sp. MGV TaxID=2023130 RepID=UPI000B96DB78|nr:DUF2997 domain-containing protein [Rhodopirellula sp. MGV]OYP33984.1 hypothetical protein CGZ80_17575 [Rhodopirellula sp. MGV]PNY37263.1 DUF2997 domain-containing protein [Rhodopirellula baltica]